MSTTYHGTTGELIILPGDSKIVAPNGLITFSREYACASDYAGTAEALLTSGSSPVGGGGGSVYLFTKTRRDDGPITTFSCVYHGFSGGELVTYTKSVRSFSKTTSSGTITGRYMADTRTVSVARAVADSGSGTEWSDGIEIIDAYLNGVWYDGTVDLGTVHGELVEFREQNFGEVEVATWTHATATIYG